MQNTKLLIFAPSAAMHLPHGIRWDPVPLDPWEISVLTFSWLLLRLMTALWSPAPSGMLSTPHTSRRANPPRGVVHEGPAQSISPEFPSTPDFIFRYNCTPESTARLQLAAEPCTKYALAKHLAESATRQQHQPKT